MKTFKIKVKYINQLDQLNSCTAWADHIMCGTNIWDDDERKGEDETRRRLTACLLEKHQGGRQT